MRSLVVRFVNGEGKQGRKEYRVLGELKPKAVEVVKSYVAEYKRDDVAFRCIVDTFRDGTAKVYERGMKTVLVGRC